MSNEIKIAEIFYSLQGEGLYTGTPSVFIRTFGCNFQCRGFGMTEGSLTDEPERIADSLLGNETYNTLPLALTGCDSYASWHPKFKQFSPKMTPTRIVEQVLTEISNKRPWTKQDLANIHIVITGGEPLLGWQRNYIELLNMLQLAGFRYVTFETNGTQELTEDLKKYLMEDNMHVTFSVSAKLPSSGEPWEKAIRPDIVEDYQRYGHETFLKLVVASDKDMADVAEAVAQYKSYGFNGPVYLMPCGGDPALYDLTAPDVAELALIHGYRYSPRLQVDLWKNEWGT